MVLRFLSGLTKFNNYPQQDLALILEPQDYRYGQSGLNFHLLFEAQNVEYISSVLKKDVFSVDRLSTPFEAYALGYCVAHSNLQWESRFDLDSTMSDMLIRGLQAEETQCRGTVEFGKLEIEIKYGIHLIKPTTLRFLRRINCKVSLSDVTTYTQLVEDLTSCFTSLEVTVKDNEIQITKNNKMKLEHCKILGELIRSSTSLRHFTMDTLQYHQMKVKVQNWLLTCVHA